MALCSKNWSVDFKDTVYFDETASATASSPYNSILSLRPVQQGKQQQCDQRVHHRANQLMDQTKARLHRQHAMHDKQRDRAVEHAATEDENKARPGVLNVDTHTDRSRQKAEYRLRN